MKENWDSFFRKFIVVSLGILTTIIFEIYAAVVPPPWADPKLNPCAVLPRGWQLIYWPPDGKCYRIFQKGHPCPDDMELNPAPYGKKEYSAECRCPPTTGQSARDGRCYELFTNGPCQTGHYFVPDDQIETNKRRWGTCKQITRCPNINEIFWAKTGKCYSKYTKGPCPKGQLLTLNAGGLGSCKCDEDLREFKTSNGCHQHFTRGPCKEQGQLFLPDKTCGCHKSLPHYHNDTEMCYELNTIGPCDPGEQYQLDATSEHGTCSCKPGYIRYIRDSKCYRPFTEGPCGAGNFLINATDCAEQPCERGQLYFPEDERCYRVGTKGPCTDGRIVTFDFTTRPSVDGVSYNGVCECRGGDCGKSAVECGRNMLRYEGRCYGLYTQGPCVKGAWVVPKREGKGKGRQGYCDCMPGYDKAVRRVEGKEVVECLSPTVFLANYMNRYFARRDANVTAIF